jgi:predicted kinase
MPKCLILSGIPTSGKSTFAKKCGFSTLSCDEIRKELKEEKLVWDKFYRELNYMDVNICIDNTNCKLSYINEIKENLNKNVKWDIEIKKFPVTLHAAYYRNIIRYLKTGKFIPFKVIKSMYKNYNNLWKNV